jgi:hypothetical protein
VRMLPANSKERKDCRICHVRMLPVNSKERKDCRICHVRMLPANPKERKDCRICQRRKEKTCDARKACLVDCNSPMRMPVQNLLLHCPAKIKPALELCPGYRRLQRAPTASTTVRAAGGEPARFTACCTGCLRSPRVSGAQRPAASCMATYRSGIPASVDVFKMEQELTRFDEHL